MASIILTGNKATKLEDLCDAISTADSQYILIADASASFSQSQLEELAAAGISDSEIAFIATADTAKEELESLDAESIMSNLVNRTELPVTALLISKSDLQNCLSGQAESFAEAAIEILAKAISEGSSLRYAGSASQAKAQELSNSTCARMLSLAVNTFAIEELFPQQAWKEHSEESAATSYHTLAAYFMRFEDFSNATDCLKLSEQFEESPRSLALRALIAFNKGETLGAVANLVSSLQQYEERKRALLITLNSTLRISN